MANLKDVSAPKQDNRVMINGVRLTAAQAVDTAGAIKAEVEPKLATLEAIKAALRGLASRRLPTETLTITGHEHEAVVGVCEVRTGYVAEHKAELIRMLLDQGYVEQISVSTAALKGLDAAQREKYLTQSVGTRRVTIK